MWPYDVHVRVRGTKGIGLYIYLYIYTIMYIVLVQGRELPLVRVRCTPYRTRVHVQGTLVLCTMLVYKVLCIYMYTTYKVQGTRYLYIVLCTYLYVRRSMSTRHTHGAALRLLHRNNLHSRSIGHASDTQPPIYRATYPRTGAAYPWRRAPRQRSLHRTCERNCGPGLGLCSGEQRPGGSCVPGSRSRRTAMRVRRVCCPVPRCTKKLHASRRHYPRVPRRQPLCDDCQQTDASNFGKGAQGRSL